MKLKTFSSALALSLVASGAMAGSMAAPVTEPFVQVAEAPGSLGSAGTAGAVALGLVLVGVAVAASNGT